MNRTLPDQQFFYKGALTTGSALVTPNSTYAAYVKQIILTNISADDVTVTLTTGETSPGTEATIVVSGRDQWVHDYEQGWEFTQGIKASASANSSIRAQIWGFQKPT